MHSFRPGSKLGPKRPLSLPGRNLKLRVYPHSYDFFEMASTLTYSLDNLWASQDIK